MVHLLLLVIYLCTGTLSQTVVRGVVGQDITLPCTYSVRDGTNIMCWGRGSCPNSKCSDEILRTNGMRVTSRTSSRYQLRGWVWRGDVSLTIVNLKEGDKGMYCCRIELPGWFNDLKKTLNLQVDRATTTTTTTTTSQTTTTTKSHTVSVTSTSVPVPTTLTPPTTTPFFLTMDHSAVPTATPLTTHIPPVITSSMTEVTEFLTSDPPFVKISPSTTSLQITYGDAYYFPTTESEITTSTAGTLLTPKNTENIDNLPTSVSVAITNTSHTVAMLSAQAPLSTTVAVPAISPFPSPATSPTTPTAALPVTNVSSFTTASTSTAVTLLTASPPLVNIKSPSACLQHECTEDGSSSASEATSAGVTLADNYVAVSCAVVVFVLLLVLLVLIMKRKNIREYQLNKTKSVNKAEEPENMLIGTEGENGLFTL